MRAWIEIIEGAKKLKEFVVALFMRAWIEISSSSLLKFVVMVALFMRAWIEINGGDYFEPAKRCRSLHESVD